MKASLPTGKVPYKSLMKAVLGHLGVPNNRLLLGPAIGEDAAIIEMTGEVLPVFLIGLERLMFTASDIPPADGTFREEISEPDGAFFINAAVDILFQILGAPGRFEPVEITFDPAGRVFLF